MKYGLVDFLTLIGALGFFIYGMKVMSDGIQKVAGSRMRKILEAMTSNRWMGVFTGFIITSLIQSSSATTVMVVSFVNAGLLSLTESLGVIMGANMGTTLTAWLISIVGFKVKISTMALPIIGIGFPMMFSKNKNLRFWAEVLIGFALLFMGLDALKDSVPDLKSNPEVLNFLQQYTNRGMLSVLLFISVGTIITIIVQSSSAAMALTLVMCNEGWIPFSAAAAMILGENIGTTITANIAALVGNIHAKRAARGHLIFNLIGVVWMIFALPIFTNQIDRYFESNPELAGVSEVRITWANGAPAENWSDGLSDFQITPVADEPAVHISLKSSEDHGQENVDTVIASQLAANGIANSAYELDVLGSHPSTSPHAIPLALSLFHSLFNFINVLLLIWFVPQIVKIVTRLVPTRAGDDEVFHLEYIGGGLMATPELSLMEARKEVNKLGQIVQKQYQVLPKLLQPSDDKKFNRNLERVSVFEDISDRMEYEIAQYLTKTSEGELSSEGSANVRTMLSIISDLEIIGDLCYQIGQNLERRRASKAYFTPELRSNSELMITKVNKALEIMMRNLRADKKNVNLEEARNIEDEINSLRDAIRSEHLQNVESGVYKIQSGMYYLDLIQSLEKIADLVYNISLALVKPL